MKWYSRLSFAINRLPNTVFKISYQSNFDKNKIFKKNMIFAERILS